MQQSLQLIRDPPNTLSAPRKLRVAVASGHSEAMVPGAAGYEIFFALLASLPVEVEKIEGPLTPEALASLDALLIGAPGRELDGREHRALRHYLRRGGRIFVLSDAGGDDRPRGRSGSAANVARLLGRGCWLHGVAGRFATADRRSEKPQPFHLSLELDASSVLGHPGIFSYEAGPVMDFGSKNVVISPDSSDALGARSRAGFLLRRRGIFGWLSGRDRKWHLSHALLAPAWASNADVMRRDGHLASFSEGKTWPVRPVSLLFLRRRLGQGRITYLGSCRSLRDDHLARGHNVDFLHRLMELWLPGLFDLEVSRRAATPQRHRLLQGYPMAPAMDLQEAELEEPAVTFGLSADLSRSDPRSLIVGVLPHSFCNPKLTGCGFCTFPHETFSKSRANAVVGRVMDEIDAAAEHGGDLHRRRVDALYFGGGTANLTPPEGFEKLCRKLSATFDLSDAEVTLEGVPIYFLTRDARLLDILQEALPARHHRISMGVQTFDPEQLERMGRAAFGGREDIARLVELAHDRGMTVSGDLLFNLPGQSTEQMTSDVEIAEEIGFDQICLYHLVMFEGLGTAWSQDPELLAWLPDNRLACDNWKELSETMLIAGYDPTTLTNFEHERVIDSGRRFLYEPLGFRPEKTDALGFGPGGISQSYDFARGHGQKRINPVQADAYCAAVERHGRSFERSFDYRPIDLKVLYLTRRVALLGFSRAAYHDLFASDPLDDFAGELTALAKVGLLEIGHDDVRLTRDGMFYADTIAGLLAWRRLAVHQMTRQAASVPLGKRATFQLARYPAAVSTMG